MQNSTEQLQKIENLPGRRQKIGQFIGKVGLAATCIIPTADLALSDISFAKAYEVTQEKIEADSEPIERGLETGIMGSAIAAESIGLGIAITKAKKLQNAFHDFDDYLQEKEKTMKPTRRVISRAVNAPFAGLKKLGEGFEKIGEKIAARKSRIARVAGKLLIDTGTTNVIGTSGVIMQETMAGKPPSLARNARLAGIITGSWLGVAEGIRSIYRGIPEVRPPLAAIGRTYELLTTINLAHPWETPVGSVAISATALALAVTGWRIAEFHQQKEELTQINHEEAILSSDAIVPQHMQSATELSN